jgi:hypothetical protein
MSGLSPPLRKIVLLVAPLCAAMIICLCFPYAWYTKAVPGQSYLWLNEHTNLSGWTFKPVDVGQAAERILVADNIVNGEFFSEKTPSIRVFSARRYKENPNEIGLFVHTPDRCWTEAGWSIEPAAPDLSEIKIHDTIIPFERRIFSGPGQKELVYFCGLTAGQPLPYRLDHNLSVGMRYKFRNLQQKGGAALRASDKTLWTRVWESFQSRRQLFGPKQFLRISTSVLSSDTAEADQRLHQFLIQWLVPADYRLELNSWESAHKK